MKSLWGEDAWEFKPERWLNGGQGIPASAKDLQGHRHLITFVNGPRTCLGKQFALAEFKVSDTALSLTQHDTDLICSLGCLCGACQELCL
jgi:cytochrome P450